MPHRDVQGKYALHITMWHELSQPIIQKALVQAPFGGGSIRQVRSILILFGLGTTYQLGEVQVFENKHLVVCDKLLGLLVMEVSSLVVASAASFVLCVSCGVTQ
jgi:hypothetical protein